MDYETTALPGAIEAALEALDRGTSKKEVQRMYADVPGIDALTGRQDSIPGRVANRKAVLQANSWERSSDGSYRALTLADLKGEVTAKAGSRRIKRRYSGQYGDIAKLIDRNATARDQVVNLRRIQEYETSGEVPELGLPDLCSDIERGVGLTTLKARYGADYGEIVNSLSPQQSPVDYKANKAKVLSSGESVGQKTTLLEALEDIYAGASVQTLREKHGTSFPGIGGLSANWKWEKRAQNARAVASFYSVDSEESELKQLRDFQLTMLGNMLERRGKIRGYDLTRTEIMDSISGIDDRLPAVPQTVRVYETFEGSDFWSKGRISERPSEDLGEIFFADNGSDFNGALAPVEETDEQYFERTFFADGLEVPEGDDDWLSELPLLAEQGDGDLALASRRSHFKERFPGNPESGPSEGYDGSGRQGPFDFWTGDSTLFGQVSDMGLRVPGREEAEPLAAYTGEPQKAIVGVEAGFDPTQAVEVPLEALVALGDELHLRRTIGEKDIPDYTYLEPEQLDQEPVEVFTRLPDGRLGQVIGTSDQKEPDFGRTKGLFPTQAQETAVQLVDDDTPVWDYEAQERSAEIVHDWTDMEAADDPEKRGVYPRPTATELAAHRASQQNLRRGPITDETPTLQ